MKKVLRMFGRYLLLDHLAQGGMAEIFRAWAPSVDDGGRLIVLKCVQPDFGQDTEFLQMFRSEIRVSIGLNHPNIVQLYDFGEAEGRPYIAMELVEGRSLKQIIQQLARFDKRLPVEFAAYAIEQVAAGLHYAHSFRDRTSGEALNIVHRDISPQNLLVSFTGNVKIIDFGIAKAASNRQTTRAGIIKGKPSYLSPEQITGEVLDGRSDVFSLGAVFWELLTGIKLFSGDSDLAAIKLIDNCDEHVRPPSTINPDVPPEIDAIIMKSLVHDREKRYKTAEELQRAIHRAIYSFNPSFDPSDFANYLSEVFAKEIDQEQRDLQLLNNEAKKIIRESSLDRVPSLDVSEKFTAEGTEETDFEEDEDKNTASKTVLEGSDVTSVSDILVSPAREKRKIPLAPRAENSGARYYESKLSSEKINLERPQHTRTMARPISIDDDDEPSSSILPKIIFGGLILAGAGYYFYAPELADKFGKMKIASSQQTAAPTNAATATSAPQTQAPVQAQVQTQAPAPAPTKFALLKLDLVPSGGAIDLRINGHPMNASLPIQLPLSLPLEFRLEKPGFKPAVKNVTLTQAGDFPLQIYLEPERAGLLTLHTTPSAKVQIMQGDLLWTLSSPIDQMRLPVGNYSARLTNDLLGLEKRITFEILQDKIITQDVDLSPK